MSAELALKIRAIDEATEVIRRVSEETKRASDTVRQANEQVARSSGEVVKAQEAVARSSESTWKSFKELTTGISGVTTAAFALYQGWDKLQDMQVSIGRANLQVQSSLNALEDAQRRYNAAVEKYGPASEQAEAAMKDLQLAQERYTLAVERADMVQGNYQEAMVSFALSIIPTTITAIDNLIKVKQVLSRSLESASESVGILGKALNLLAANPIVLVAAAIAGLILALKHLYDTNESFRNAVNALGAALMNILKPAIEAIINALTWLWNNVIKPVAEAFGWFVNTIKGAFQALTGATETAKIEASQDIQEIKNQAVSMGETVRIYSTQAGSAVSGFATTVKDSEKVASTAFQNISTSAQRMAEEVYKGYTKVADGVYVAIDALKRAALEAARAIGQVWDEYERRKEKAMQTAAGGGKATPAWPGQPTGKQYGSLGGVPAQTEAPPFKLEPVQTLPGGIVVHRLVEGQFGFEGLVRRPTLFLAGEAGPEYVSIRPEGRGGGISIQGPLVYIEGSADERTVAKAVKEMERLLRSIILEATSSNAPAWSKRIRFGGGW